MKELIIKDSLEEYLSESKYINWNNECIRKKAEELRTNRSIRTRSRDMLGEV